MGHMVPARYKRAEGGEGGDGMQAKAAQSVPLTSLPLNTLDNLAASLLTARGNTA